MLEPEAVQAALFAAAGEVQTLMNHLGLAARSAPTAKLVFESDMRSALRRAFQFGRSEMVSVETALGKQGVLAEPTDVVVFGKTRTPQLALELTWHPRGEDHPGFGQAAVGKIAKLATARTANAVEQAAVLIGAPIRFWRWVPSYAEERAGYDLLIPDPQTPVSEKSDFLADSTWEAVLPEGVEAEVPERLWTSHLASAEIHSPWAEMELHLLEVKGLGPLRSLNRT
jgi:hypothetical protein